MSIESRLKTVRRNTGNHKSESAMSKENLKKNKKNYWFSITLIALALFCVGAALLYSQKLLGEKLSTPKAPVASCTARYGSRSISKVQFLKRDMLLDKDKTSINWLKSIRAAQRKKNIKHLYDEYKNVGIFQVTEDVKYNSLFATYKLKLLKNIKSTHPCKSAIRSMLILSTVPVWMRIPFLPSIKAATLHLCCARMNVIS